MSIEDQFFALFKCVNIIRLKNALLHRKKPIMESNQVDRNRDFVPIKGEKCYFW